MADSKTHADISEQLPSSLDAIRKMFEDFNVSDVSDEICTRILDVLYKYTCDVVEEANAIAKHIGHSHIEESDMKLAIESMADGLMFAPPHKEQLLAYAERNSIPLPAIRSPLGLQLPTDKNNLTAPNYTLVKPGSENESQPVANGRDLPPTAEMNPITLTAVPASTPQNLFRLSAASNTITPGSSVRVIAPTGTGPSMIRIQSVQGLVHMSPDMFTTRAIPVSSANASIPTVQRRLMDGS